MATVKKDEQQDTVAEQTPMYTKEQYLQSERYTPYRDALSALLEDDKAYTHDEVQNLVNDFMNRTVE